jgi:hypothetical protein
MTQSAGKPYQDFEHLRSYFETGCLCILSKRIPKLDINVSDVNAVAYYEAACTCSRNYVSNDQYQCTAGE